MLHSKKGPLPANVIGLRPKHGGIDGFHYPLTPEGAKAYSRQKFKEPELTSAEKEREEIAQRFRLEAHRLELSGNDGPENRREIQHLNRLARAALKGEDLRFVE